MTPETPTLDLSDHGLKNTEHNGGFNSQNSAKFLTRPVAVTGYIYIAG